MKWLLDSNLSQSLFSLRTTEKAKWKKKRKKENRSYRDTVLQGADIIGVREFDNWKFVLFLHVLNPLVGLTLRINHQWPSSRVIHNNPVVDWEWIHGETSNVPGADFDWATESSVQREWFGAGNFLCITLFYPAWYTVLYDKEGKKNTQLSGSDWRTKVTSLVSTITLFTGAV